jgi:nucleotide-binding universal stress UspA family protein
MKDLLVFLSPSPRRDQLSVGAHCAIALARMYGAHLSAMVADIEPDLCDMPPEPDIRQVARVATKPVSSSQRVARMAEIIQSAAADAKLPCDILGTESQFASLRERLIHCTQLHDILIMDVRGPLEPPRRDLVEAALFGSGRPILLVPPKSSAIPKNRIVIAWDGTRPAVRALRDAMPFLVRSREVLVVSVVDDKALSTGDSGDALCRYLARWHIDAKFNAVRRESLHVGVTLLDYAWQADADLLVMGAFAHGFEHALKLGSATRDIFDTRIELPVLMSH